MKKTSLMLIILILALITSVVSAEEIDSDTLVNDMRNNSKNYVYIGHMSNAGDSIYVMRSSIDVQEYKPPKYIIEISCAQFWARGLVPSRTKDIANLFGSFKFLYDYDSKKIYIEDKVENNKFIWRYIEEKTANRGLLKKSTWEFAAAELAFYWAYNMSFYDKPVSDLFKYYLEKGKGTFGNL